MIQSKDFSALLRRAIRGDRDAVTQLLATHEARLLRRLHARLAMNPFADFSAEDVLQEAFADIHEGIGGLRSEDPLAVSAWLDRVTDNRLAKTMRDRSRAKRGGRRRPVAAADSSILQLINDLQDERAETGSELFVREEVKIAINQAMGTLPDPQREVIDRYYLQQQNLGEISDDLQTTKTAIRSLIYRAKQAMRLTLGNSSQWYHAK